MAPTRAACRQLPGLQRFSKIALPEGEGAGDTAALAAELAKLRLCEVVLWPEPGEYGRRNAQQYAEMLIEAGAAAVGRPITGPRISGSATICRTALPRATSPH